LAAGIPPDRWLESMSTLQRTRIPLRSRSHCKTKTFSLNIRCSILPVHMLVPAERWSSSTGTLPDRQSQSIRSSPQQRRLCCCRPFRSKTRSLLASLRSNILLHSKAMASVWLVLAAASELVSAGRTPDCSGPQPTSHIVQSGHTSSDRQCHCNMTMIEECVPHSIPPPVSASATAW